MFTIDFQQNAFFKIFPKFVGNLALDQPLQVEGSCFQDVVAIANKNEDGSVTVTINLVKFIQIGCTFYWQFSSCLVKGDTHHCMNWQPHKKVPVIAVRAETSCRLVDGAKCRQPQ